MRHSGSYRWVILMSDTHEGQIELINFNFYECFVCFFRAGTDLNVIQFLDIFSDPNQNQLEKQKKKKGTKRTWQELVGIGLFVEHFQEHSNAFMCLNFDVANFCSCENINYVYNCPASKTPFRCGNWDPHHQIKICRPSRTWNFIDDSDVSEKLCYARFHWFENGLLTDINRSPIKTDNDFRIPSEKNWVTLFVLQFYFHNTYFRSETSNENWII